MLQLSELTAGYHEYPVLHDVSLSVGAGEFVAIIGSNSAGKSTLLRTIVGALHPRSGSVRFLGQEISRLPVHQVTGLGIALVPEGRQVFDRLSVLDNLVLGAYSRGARYDVNSRLKQVYQLFPILLERKSQRAGTMSGGQQQMVAIGRALMSDPKLLILDEPSLGLSPKVADEVMAAVKLISQTGTAVLLVEQNVQLTLQMASRAYVLQNGRVVMEGAGASLLADDQVRKAYLGL